MADLKALRQDVTDLLLAVRSGDKERIRRCAEPIFATPETACLTAFSLAQVAAQPARAMMRPGATALPLFPDDVPPEVRAAGQLIAAAARGDGDLMRDLLAGLAVADNDVFPGMMVILTQVVVSMMPGGQS